MHRNQCSCIEILAKNPHNFQGTCFENKSPVFFWADGDVTKRLPNDIAVMLLLQHHLVNWPYDFLVMSPQQRSHGDIPKRLFEPPPPSIITYINYILNTVMYYILASLFSRYLMIGLAVNWFGGAAAEIFEVLWTTCTILYAELHFNFLQSFCFVIINNTINIVHEYVLVIWSR